MPSIEITIAGQKYVLKSEENPDHLREVAELVRRRVESIQKKNPTLSLQKAAMLVAFDFASESIKGKRRSVDTKKNLLAKAEALLERVENEAIGRASKH